MTDTAGLATTNKNMLLFKKQFLYQRKQYILIINS